MLGGNVKIVMLDENSFLIYLNRDYISEINFEEKYELEAYFKVLLSKLKTYYDIEMCGYYHIKCYIDSYYGIILYVQKEDVEYFDYLDNQVDMRMILEEEQCFLYRIFDYFDFPSSLKKKGDIYQYKKMFYYKLNEKLDSILFGKLLEYSEIVFENTLPILKYGKKVA